MNEKGNSSTERCLPVSFVPSSLLKIEALEPVKTIFLEGLADMLRKARADGDDLGFMGNRRFWLPGQVNLEGIELGNGRLPERALGQVCVGVACHCHGSRKACNHQSLHIQEEKNTVWIR